jgi:RimJ/RimL family protein N-acetyltransferase
MTVPAGNTPRNPSFRIRTERLVLRLYREGDEVWMHRLYSRPEVVERLLDYPWDEEFALDRLKDRIARTDLDGSLGTLALVVEHEGAPVGDVMVWRSERGTAEIGWVLDPDHGGQGFGTEAVKEVLDLCFRIYGLHRVVARMDARNEASARLAARVGMTQEAHFRSDWWIKGEWTDTLVFARLADDRRG